MTRVVQMARHVFQYDVWEPSLGLYIGDPSTLPPLEIDYRRPPVRYCTYCTCMHSCHGVHTYMHIPPPHTLCTYGVYIMDTYTHTRLNYVLYMSCVYFPVRLAVLHFTVLGWLGYYCLHLPPLAPLTDRCVYGCMDIWMQYTTVSLLSVCRLYCYTGGGRSGLGVGQRRATAWSRAQNWSQPSPARRLCCGRETETA